MSIQFIAVLDFEHLENTVFLNAFARSLSQLGDRKGLIIHGDSPYTERLIQTGMMREDARLRAIKDLNKRLIGLFADQGIPTIGLHGFQKGLITAQDEAIKVDMDALNSFHSAPNLLISTLVDRKGVPEHVPLPAFTKSLSNTFDEAEILLFSKNEKDEILISDSKDEFTWDKLPSTVSEDTLPEEFKDFGHPVKVTTAGDFGNWPDLKKTTIIRPN